MTSLLQNAPSDEPTCQFLDRKRADSKPYYVYMTAGANKFLRCYYSKVHDFFLQWIYLPCGILVNP